MELKYNPKSLEEIAFVHMHYSIIDNLEFALKQPRNRCLSARTEAWIESVSYASIITTNPYSTSMADVVSIIRNHLSRTLVGIVNDDIRKRLLLCFNKDTVPPRYPSIEFMSNTEEFVDFLLAYLDCVLDESITRLKVPCNLPVTFLHGNNSTNFFEIIAKHSPFLHDIELNFNSSYISRTLNFHPESPKMFINSLQLLKSLTSLHISQIHYEYRPIFQYIGSSLPALKSLTICNYPITAEDILALIGGHHHETLLQESNRLADRLPLFQTNADHLTPICATLKYLQLGGGKLVRDVPVPVIAFLLCHMPNLKTCIINPNSVGIILAVELLHQLSKPGNPTASDQCDEDSLIILNRNPLPPRKLSLIELDYITVDNETKLEAALVLCPRLEKVKFCQSATLSVTTTTSTNITPMVDHQISSLQFKAILNNWSPNLRKVSFNDVPADYRQVILDQFRNNLTELSYEGVYNINPLELSSCTKLKSLKILQRTSFMNHQSENDNEFLPKLKKLKLDVCLGAMSWLFQKKSSYTSLDIACCHVASDEKEWMQIAQIWPHVRTLRIRRCKGLDQTLAHKVFSKFSKLKELALSESMVVGDTNLKDKLMAEKVIHLLFLQDQGYIYCPLFGNKADWCFDH